MENKYITQTPSLQTIKEILESLGADSQFWMVMPKPWLFELTQSKRTFTLLATRITHSLALIQFEDDRMILQMDWRDILLNAQCLKVE